MEGVFHGTADDYNRDFGFMDAYVRQTAIGLSRKYDIPYEEAVKFVEDEMKEDGEFPIEDPEVRAIVQDRNEDRVKKTIPFSKMMDTIVERGLIVSPALAVYKPKTEELAFTVELLEEGLAKRNQHKTEMFIARQNKDWDLADLKNNEQKNDKIGVNALSGAQATVSTILYVANIHPSLTSLCRTASSFANSNNDRILAGSRHYRSPEILHYDMLSIIEKTDLAAFVKMMDKFGLHYPTTEEVWDMIKRSTKRYFSFRDGGKEIRKLLDGMFPVERAAILYTSDLHHVRVYNDQFMRDLLEKMALVGPNHEDPKFQNLTFKEAKGNTSGDMQLLATLLCSDLMPGLGLKKFYEDGDEASRPIVSATMSNIYDVVHEYGDFFRCIFNTPCMPPSIFDVPDFIREVGLMSDTDSAVYNVTEWRAWYEGTHDLKALVSKRAEKIGHAVSYCVGTSIIHILATMSANLGVAKEDIFMYQMKPEFYFGVFCLTSRAKTYFAEQTACEGVLPEEQELETKGAVFAGSAAPQDLIADADQLRTDIINTIKAGEEIDLHAIVKKNANLERDVYKRMLDGDSEIFGGITIKPATAYSKGPTESNHVHYLIWQAVFAKKYGEAELPPYKGIRINLTTDTARKFQNWLDNLEDRDIAQRMAFIMADVKKTNISTLIVPEAALKEHGLPKELIPILDDRKLIRGSMQAHYASVECLNFLVQDKHSSRMFSDMH